MFKSGFFGKQEWALSNLDVVCFANGDLIPEVRRREDWVLANTERRAAWCYYNNDPATGILYGKLYNWYAINDERGICPPGWHIPSDSEWRELIELLGGYKSAGKIMKSLNLWENAKSIGTNESDFNILPSGYRNFYGDYFFLNQHAYFWSSTQHHSHLAWYHSVDFFIDDVLRYYNVKGNGFSCRCVKDVKI